MSYAKTGLFAAARKALKQRSKFIDDRGLDTRKNYSSFWMDDRWDNASKFSGLGESVRSGSDVVKLVKLSNYRRAITNFVKIVTKQDIPVQWAGSMSYTDGKSITLSTDIKDNNFDVTVGLALHEASHIILTNFDSLERLRKLQYPSVKAFDMLFPHNLDTIKSLLNWVEDRRIDNFIFTTSPGYKAYYHKLYDYYWNSKDITKGFLSAKHREVTVDNYMFHIINMMNPSFNTKAMPRLDEIAKLVDLRNIVRVKSTDESMEIAVAIAHIIFEEVANSGNKAQQKPQPTDDMDEQDGTGMSMSGDGADGTDDDGDSADGDDSIPTEEMTQSELNAIDKAIDKQKDFLDGKTGKKSATKKLAKQLDKVAEQSIEVQTVGGEDGVGNITALLYDFTNNTKVLEAAALADKLMALENSKGAYSDKEAIRSEIQNLLDTDVMHTYISSNYSEQIQAGYEMGGLLGKRLQLHNETRERVDTRLRSGRIDNKRLAHAGYGIESIFKQIHVDKYKKANLHISLDGSGSMGGSKWENTIRMTAAIVKAATYTQNINVQVSVRITVSAGAGDTPANVMMYDSRKNKLNQFTSAFKLFSPMSMTPEGLCFEAMIKKNLLLSSTSDVDSYFLNLSDGGPGCTNYNGDAAVRHTKKQVDKMKTVFNMQVISFFITSVSTSLDKEEAYARLVQRFNEEYGEGRNFKLMYGKDATVVAADNAIQIAKELNKKFLTVQ